MVITIFGDNEYLIKTELNKLTSGFKTKHGDLSVETFNSDSDLNRLSEAVNNIGLFSSDKLVILNELSGLKEFSESFESLLSNVPNSTSVIVVEPKLDKRLSLYKYLSTKTDFRNFSALEPNALNNWMADYVKSLGGSISLADARYLSERAGVNQLKLANEVDKLVLYDKNISRESIDLLTEDSYQNNIFQLIEAAFSGKAKTASKILINLRQQKIEPPQIIATLTWQLNLLAVVKFAEDLNPLQIAKDFKQKPFVINKARQLADQISQAKLKYIIEKLFKIDFNSKNINTDTDESLANFILELS